MTPRYSRSQLMAKFDAKSPTEVRAEARADRMTAGYLYTEARCEEHGVIEYPDEGTDCPICHEPCDMRPVCR